VGDFQHDVLLPGSGEDVGLGNWTVGPGYEAAGWNRRFGSAGTRYGGGWAAQRGTDDGVHRS